ncbi:ROK family transcriptional regulator [Mycolicibacterium smegmatis]|uniref:ROK family protein n=1 Tax=Mycolicibacterium smegmatis (strain ATCC 700084 / mc(2)155) TaxID=246196 RepID=A0QQZ7_MYCS2|nr:ROK family protein [Mycolicibacterium smegmatis MC2 155]TBM42118.1 ROK family transcriptional regulator [Mycolicibacterium smegmatis]TBH46345.1 ROK family transcriptional regulator [Mycolicibacterium smegmatis MC2 155]TBM51717.1 ROK family transcriptional regulator [Mycolicibacterium smegmatis]TBM62714.1 ROK family transcriptional regulator [Mycolicibacterium smegmatis]
MAPSLKVPDAAAASVFNAVRLRGPIARDVIAQHTSLSIATVNRQVTALLEAGVLRERADLAVSGAIGRPRVPVEVNHEPYLTLGVHIGAKTTAIVATDLLGRTLDVVETPTPTGTQAAALATLASSARRYLSRWHRRRPLWVGVAAGGVVDSATGYLDHPRLGWADAPVGPVLAEALGLPVSMASHVDAMAGAELLLSGRRAENAGGASRTSLYVYARETVGYALSIDGRVHSPASGPGTIAGLPARSELLGGTGQLESTVSDEAVLNAARRLRIVPAEGPASTLPAVLRAARGGNEKAVELLADRARVLGEAVALLRDMLNPDELVVGGQAFTEYPEGMEAVEAAFAERSMLGPRDIRLTAFGNRVQEAGAGVVSLGGLYADPIGAMRRAQTRRAAAV